MLSEALLQELHRILKEDYGKDLDRKELVEVASTLVGTFDLLAKVYHRTKQKEKTSNQAEHKKLV